MLNLNYITDENINPLIISEAKPIFIRGLKESDDKKSADIEIGAEKPITIHNKLIIKLKNESFKSDLIDELFDIKLLSEDLVAGMWVYEVETATIAAKVANELETLDYVEFATVEKTSNERPAILAGTRTVPTELAETSTSSFGISYTNWAMRPEYLNMQEVWKYVKGDGVIIGISDEGVEKTHPDLSNNYLTGWEITNSTLTQNGGLPITSSKAHGTNVAGMSAADQGAGKAIGTAPEAYIKSFNFFTATTDLQTVQHYDKLRSDGCSVINCSWGSPTYFKLGKENYVPHIIVTTALNVLEDNNVILVRVSGNSGDVGYLKQDSYTGLFGPYNEIDHSISENLFEDHSIVVASVTDKESTGMNIITRSDFSSMGEYVDIAAFGGNYIDPTVGDTFTTHITGSAISTEMKAMLLDGSTPFGVSSSDFTSTGGYSTTDLSELSLTGTSFSAPQIAGIIAVIKSANPYLTNDEVKDCLYSTANKINNKYWTPNGYKSTEVQSSLLNSNNLPYKQFTTIGAYKAANPTYNLPNLANETPIYVFAQADSGMISTMFRIDLYYIDNAVDKDLVDKKMTMGYAEMPNNDFVYFGVDIYGLVNPTYTNRTDGYTRDKAYGSGVVNPVDAVKKALSKGFKLELNSNSENYYMVANPGYPSAQFYSILNNNPSIEKIFKTDTNKNFIPATSGVDKGEGVFVKTNGNTTITFPAQTVNNIGDVVVDKRNDVSINTWNLLGATTNIRVDSQTNQTYYVFRNDIWYSHPQMVTNGKVKTRPLHVINKGEAYWYKKDIQTPIN